MKDLNVLVKQEVGNISFNYEELKDNLSEMMGVYKELVFTEDTCADGKRDTATLRKFIKALEDKRKAVKNEFMVPYMEFEAKTKELVSLIQEPILLIEAQTKEFDEKRRAEKQQKVVEIFNELVGELSEFITLDRIKDSKWENLSTSEKSIREEMSAKLDSISMSLETIKLVGGEFVDKGIEKFKSTLDSNAAVQTIRFYENQKQEILEREEARKLEEQRREEARVREEARLKEEARIREEERVKAEEERERIAREESLKQLSQPEEEPFIVEEEEPFVSEDLEKPFDAAPTSCSFTYVLHGTEEDMKLVEDILSRENIAFERV